MMLEGLAEWHVVDPHGDWLAPVEATWAAKGWEPGVRFAWRQRLFSSHDDVLARARDDDLIASAFVAETATMLQACPRDDGLMVFPLRHSRLPAGRRPLLVDAMHEYASRLASAASLGGDRAWYDVAAQQFIGYRAVLRNRATGLWHLGRDWGAAPGALSPGAWSRGHGWLLRGIVETLRWLPADHSRQQELTEMLAQTLDALAPLQDDQGMWHTLLHRPEADSEPETSGTALIAYAIARAAADDHPVVERYIPLAERAIAAVCARVDPQGVVHGACCTPGLLFDDGESLYLHRATEPDDPHGAPTVLYACLGAELLAGRGRRW